MWKRWVTDTHCVTIQFRNNKTKSKCGRFRAIKMTHFLCCSMIRLKYCHQLEFFYFSYTVGDIYGQCFSENTPAFFLYLEFCWICFCSTDLHTSCYPRGLFIFFDILMVTECKHRFPQTQKDLQYSHFKRKVKRQVNQILLTLHF